MSELISIIIPVFNVRDYIGKCIESIIQQSYNNIEIIVINDGSTDGSGETCRQFADKDSRIVYVYQENQGSVGARKTGLLLAKGKYIVFADGDDYAEKDYVEKLYELIIKNDVDFVHSNYMINGINQTFTKQTHLYKEDDLNEEFRTELLRDHVFEWDTEKDTIEFNLYGCIYKKNVICDCYMELPDYQQYGEDLLCLCNLIMKCQSMMFVSDAYYHYVIREKSLTHPKDLVLALSNTFSLYREVMNNLKGYEVDSTLLDKCQMFFVNHIFGDFKLFPSEGIQINEKYVCEFTDLLREKKIVLYGAGIVGQNVYEQLTNYDSIEIVGWVDNNYKNIHSPYRCVSDPALIDSQVFDYVVISIKNESTAKEIIDYLLQMNIDRKRILWRPYLMGITLSII